MDKLDVWMQRWYVIMLLIALPFDRDSFRGAGLLSCVVQIRAGPFGTVCTAGCRAGATTQADLMYYHFISR